MFDTQFTATFTLVVQWLVHSGVVSYGVVGYWGACLIVHLSVPGEYSSFESSIFVIEQDRKH